MVLVAERARPGRPPSRQSAEQTAVVMPSKQRWRDRLAGKGGAADQADGRSGESGRGEKNGREQVMSQIDGVEGFYRGGRRLVWPTKPPIMPPSRRRSRTREAMAVAGRRAGLDEDDCRA
ncbi:hypothetical protein Dimus_010921, partial [Dionaea muscipula]